jgi:hypothetical protein
MTVEATDELLLLRHRHEHQAVLEFAGDLGR